MSRKKLIHLGAATALMLLSYGANAQWTAGANYTHYSEDGIDVGAVVGSFGYRIQATDSFYLIPEVRVGFGVTDDSIDFGFTSVDVELEQLWGVSNRFQYEFDSGAYIFGVASYINYKLKASAGGFSESDDTWESQFGAGAGYMFTSVIGGELSYERVDGEDLAMIGLRFNF